MREGLAHHLLGSLPAPALRGKALLRGKNSQKLGYTSAVDPKPPRPGLRARWTWIGVFCALLGSLGGRVFLSSRDEPPPPRRADPGGDPLGSQGLGTGHLRDALRPGAGDSAATERRANEAATRTYGDGAPARTQRPAPARLPPPRPLRFTPAPTPAPAPQLDYRALEVPAPALQSR